jgi:hypothetical protein
MPKMPAGTERYQELLQESKKLIDRLKNGERLMGEAIVRHSAASGIDIMRLYLRYSIELQEKMEEMALVHQFYALGITGSITRQGKFLTTADLVNDEVIELDPAMLLALSKLKEVFGDIPYDILEIKK